MGNIVAAEDVADDGLGQGTVALEREDRGGRGETNGFEVGPDGVDVDEELGRLDEHCQPAGVDRPPGGLQLRQGVMLLEFFAIFT